MKRAKNKAARKAKVVALKTAVTLKKVPVATGTGHKAAITAAKVKVVAATAKVARAKVSAQKAKAKADAAMAKAKAVIKSGKNKGAVKAAFATLKRLTA